jgi:hypothetical protein
MSITHVFGGFLALALGNPTSKRKRRGMLHRGVGLHSKKRFSASAAGRWLG